MTQQRSHFFLDVDNEVRLTQIFGQARLLATQLLVLLIQRMALGLRPALLRSQRFEDAVGPLTPPGGQQRGGQAFPAQESSDTASGGSGGLGFLQDALFVFRGVGAPLGFRDHFGIRPRGPQRIDARWGCHSTPLRLARLAFAPFRGSPTSRRNKTKSIPVHLSPFSFSPCSLIKSTKTVSEMLARRDTL